MSILFIGKAHFGGFCQVHWTVYLLGQNNKPSSKCLDAKLLIDLTTN